MALRYEIYGVKYKDELVYIGKTQYGMPKRRSKHKYEAFTQNYTDDFHVFIREVGWNNLEWFVIEKCNSQEEISNKEKYYIKQLKPRYNKQEKPFNVYDLDNNYIGEFSNIYKTGEILNINPKYISKCLHGNIKKTQGYIFKYVEEVI